MVQEQFIYIVTPTSVTGTCVGATYPITVTVNPITHVSVTITGASQVCSGPVSYASFPVNCGDNPTYVWKAGSTIIGNTQNITYTPTDGDVITCEVTPDPNIVCPSSSLAVSDPINMTVGSVTPTISIGTTTGSVCAGDILNFDATVTNEGASPTYVWKVNDVAVPGTNSTSFTYTAPDILVQTTDVITCELSSSSPCASPVPVISNSVNITVNPILDASVTIAADANPVSSGTSVTFTPSPTNGGSAPAYEWFVNSASKGLGATYTYAPNNGDEVYAVMTSNATPCLTGSPATSNTITMEVGTLPAGVVAYWHLDESAGDTYFGF